MIYIQSEISVGDSIKERHGKQNITKELQEMCRLKRIQVYRVQESNRSVPQSG